MTQDIYFLYTVNKKIYMNNKKRYVVLCGTVLRRPYVNTRKTIATIATIFSFFPKLALLGKH